MVTWTHQNTDKHAVEFESGSARSISVSTLTPTKAATDTAGGLTVDEAVSYDSGSAFLRPERMVDEQPYVVTVGGQKLVAVKHKQGSIDFYQLP